MISAFDQPLVREEFDLYADTVLYRQAVAFAQGHFKMTNSQINGLENVAKSTNRVQDVIDFLNHRRLKAEKDGKKRVARYWSELEKQVFAVCSEVENRWRRLKKDHLLELAYDPQNEEAILEELKLFALKDFSGHLAAENAMLPKDDNRRKGRVKPSERF
jgi:hypothetical protein